VSVHVKPVGSWNTDKVKFTVAHRAYDSSGDALPQYTSESDYTAEVDINTFHSPVVTDSTSATVSVNVFSQPINNLIVTMQFLGSTVKEFATYSRTDYDLSENAIEGSNLTGLLAESNNNNTDDDVIDTINGNYLNIGAYSTRYYLDGTNSGVYFDRVDNVDLSESFTVKVYRSASYYLFRDEVLVSIGLLTRTNDADNKIDVISEDLSGVTKSGFKLSLTHNLVDLCARLHLQSINELDEQDNYLEFIIKTKADNLNLNVASYNPVSQSYIRVERVISDLPADEDINLSDLFESVLPTISLSSVRGYPYHLDLALAGENGAVTTSNISSAIFKLRLALDNYALYTPSNGLIVNGGGRCVFTTETSPNTDVAYDFTLDNSNISISSDFSVLPSTITRLATYYNDGLGHVSYIVEDFVGHYNTEEALETSSVPASSENTGEISNNLNHTVNTATATVRTATLVNNAGTYGFSIHFGNAEKTHKIEFDNLPFEYPDSFSGKCASILYTGTRALVFYTVKAATDGLLYQDMVDNVWHFSTARSAFVGESAELKDISEVSEQSYSVILPNSTKSSATDFVNYASLKLRTKPDLFTSPNLGWAGVYINNSNIEDLTLTVTKGNGQSTTLDLTVAYSGAGLRDTEATDDEICNNTPPTHNGYTVSYNGELFFNLGVKAFLETVENFTYTINPSKVHFYEAHDQNEDNLINIDDNAGSVLTANFLSDVVYNISNSTAMNNTIKPSFSYDLNNSTVFANGWLPVLGSVLEMKFNNKFSLGYALDCFFVVKNNTFAEFDVYEISQDSNRANDNLDNSISPNSLTAIKRRKQRISNSDKWAVSNNLDAPARSGMSFKLSSNAVVTAGDIVNVYCDNSGNEDNKLSWTVTNMENDSSTVFSMSSHDDERYAELLNKALTLQ